MTVRVALLSDYPTDPSAAYGGVKAATFHLARGLARFEDLDLHVVHCDSAISADRTRMDGTITVHSLARPRRRGIPNLVADIPRLIETLRSIAPDLVNAHTPPCAVAALRSGVPTVYTIHGVARRELTHAQGLRNHLALALTAAYDRFAVRHVGDIVAISPFIEREYGPRTDAQFHLVGNPVGEEYFQAEGTAVAGRVLFAGTVSPQKGSRCATEAMRRVLAELPDAHLHLAGRLDSGSYARHLLKRVAANGWGREVSFLGAVDPAAMRREYVECALVVLPSLVETAPLVILEAMAVGRPVVATCIGGIPDLVEEGVTGFLVAPGDVEGLADRILRLLRNDGLRATMGTRAREVARRRFSMHLVAARYREIYEQVLAGTIGRGFSGTQ